MSCTSLSKLVLCLILSIFGQSALSQTGIVVVDEFGDVLPTAYAEGCGNKLFADFNGRIAIPSRCRNFKVGSLGFQTVSVKQVFGKSDTVVLMLDANELESVDIIDDKTYYVDSLENAFELSSSYYRDHWHLPLSCSISHDIIIDGNRSFLRADTAVVQYYRDVTFFSYMDNGGDRLPKYWTKRVTSTIRSTNEEFETFCPLTSNQLLKAVVPIGTSYSWYWDKLEEHQVERLSRTDDFTSYAITFEFNSTRHVWYVELYTLNQTIHQFNQLSYTLPNNSEDVESNGDCIPLPGTVANMKCVLTWINGHYMLESASVNSKRICQNLADGTTHTVINQSSITADWSMQVAKKSLTLANESMLIFFPHRLNLEQLPQNPQ